MKSIKEKQLLVKWSKAMNEPIDPDLLEEVERFNSLQKDVIESVRKNTISDLIEAQQVAEELVTKINLEYPKPPTLEEVLSLIQEETNELVQTQSDEISSTKETSSTTTQPIAKTLAEKAANHITKEVKLEEKADSFQQPNPPLVEKNLEAIQKKLKFLEQAIGKIAVTGPGGGAGDVINLDHPVTVVSSDYTLTRRDYYVGVNASSVVHITIPDSIAFPGRRIIIKDESGRCSKFPIVVYGNVDNDPGGFILKINNGAIQMIYREGWRIV